MEMIAEISKQVNQNWASVYALLPEFILFGFFLIGFLIDLFTQRKKTIAFISLIGVGLSALFTYQQLIPNQQIVSLFNHSIQLSNAIILFKLINHFAIGIVLVYSFSDERINKDKNKHAEFYYLIPLFLIALDMMCMSSHMMMMYISLEMVSFFSYGYVAYAIKDKFNAESSVKFILFGAMSSAIMLYGISILFGLAGTLTLADSSFLSTLSKAPIPLVTVSLTLVLVGFIYKITAAPFHFYAPDVYQGTSATTLVLLSVAPKIAGFAMLLNFLQVFTVDFGTYYLIWPNFHWETALSILAFLSLVVGSFVALSQVNVKRIMAYSGIAQSGFLLMGLISFSSIGAIALLYYLFIYVLMNTGAFMIISYFEQNEEAYEIDDYKGLIRKSPLASILLVVLFASLIGLPPLAGFTGKFLLFSACWQTYIITQNPFVLATIIMAAVGSILSLFYYFKIIRMMFFYEPNSVKFKKDPQLVLYLVLIPIVLLIVYFGVLPSVLIEQFQNLISSKAFIWG